MSSSSPRLYLLDVEGTTSPVSLVTKQLFPYARKHLAGYLAEHFAEPEMRADLGLLAEENRAEAEQQQVLRFPTPQTVDLFAGTRSAQDDKAIQMGAIDMDSALAYLLWLMDRDRKSTALKSIQGRIWKAGYEAGELVGTVFPDVAPALERWSGKARVAIYSSGSVEAQRLIFGHSSAGDLTPWISGYFDTRTGAKTSADSYRAIARAMGVETGEIVFCSDVVRELDAAREAGCQTRLALRDGNAPVADRNGHVAVRSFAEVD
jgi:enolase-phosphatase E1